MIKIGKYLFILIISLLLASLVSCGREESCEHRLSFVEGREPTCRADGREAYYHCLDCKRLFSDGEGKNEISSPITIKTTHAPTLVSAVAATCDEDGVGEYYECSCGKLYSDKALSKQIEEPVKIKKGHNYVDGECTSCGIFKICEHIVYAKTAGGSSYKIIGYFACLDTRIVVPEVYEGLPVTEISDFAFVEARSVKEIILPKGITTIGNSAFSGCSELESITVGAGLLTVGEKAFYGCSSLVEISLGGSVTTLGKEAFSGCTSLAGVQLGGALNKIGERAFFGCVSLERIAFPTSLTRIGKEAFRGCNAFRYAYFGAVKGWCYYSGSSYRDYEGEISSQSLASPTTAAKELKEDCCGYFWVRDEL